MSELVIAGFTAITVLMTVAPLSRSSRWWIRGLDFPRLQIFAAGLLLLVAQLTFLDLSEFPEQLMPVATVACLIYQAWWILPYLRPYPNEVRLTPAPADKDRLRILSSNVLMTNRNADALIGLVRRHQPDILVTLETDAWWQSRLDVLESDYPHTIKCALDNTYGMHVYSRLPLEDAETQFLVQPDVPSMHAMAILRSGQPVRMHFLHPAPPSPTENDESTERDAELLVVAKSVVKVPGPVIVAGDLNDVGWSATTRLFRKISGLLDPRVGRGMFNTFHAGHWFIRWPLDHLFHSRHFTLSFMRRLPNVGSDHFPVLVELVHDAAAGARQEGLTADAEDRQTANEKIAKEPVRPSDVHEPEA
ncbi:endonuclease/exonuclease/phosphatase family protein [Noviherbaspirillum soli]|uniref:endonuclease/exonuclease/phosphatase family protein n=1 Tax=Noviherbaspirillum soli TaxID=1064518 RepID=UPI00188DC39A|nr:endonuclease/exonuclease/phosphatase family protein [Noviherbaspirillum soli]